MISLLLCSHNNLSESLKQTAEMIYGDLDQCDTVTFQTDDSLAGLVADIRAKYDALATRGDPVVCLCDLPSASPYNACCAALGDTDARVIPGMSLPLLISIASERDDVTADGLDAFLDEVVRDTREGMAIHIPRELLAE